MSEAPQLLNLVNSSRRATQEPGDLIALFEICLTKSINEDVFSKLPEIETKAQLESGKTTTHPQ